jgi:hypothetical protein
MVTLHGTGPSGTAAQMARLAAREQISAKQNILSHF